MKKIHECQKCHHEYDAFLRQCPACNTPNKTFPLNKKFSRMLFLSNYKELILFITGFIGVSVFALLMNIALTNFPIEDILKTSIINFVSYAVIFGMMLCILWNDFLLIIDGARKYRSAIAGVIGGGLIIGFNFIYNAILMKCGVNASGNDNQQIVVQMVRNIPAMAFFIVVIFGPVAEEFAYRLGLFTVIRKRNRWIAYIVTVIVFTLIHFNFFSTDLANECINLPSYIIPGLILCILYEYEGFSASVYAHVLVNLLSFILILVQK